MFAINYICPVGFGLHLVRSPHLVNVIVWELILAFVLPPGRLQKTVKHKRKTGQNGEKKKVSCDSELVPHFLGNRKKQLLACEFARRPRSGSGVQCWPQCQCPYWSAGDSPSVSVSN